MCFMGIFTVVLLEFLTFVVNTRGYAIKAITLILLLWGGHWLFAAWTTGQYYVAHADRYYAGFSLVFSVVYAGACIEAANRPRYYRR